MSTQMDNVNVFVAVTLIRWNNIFGIEGKPRRDENKSHLDLILLANEIP